MGQKEWRMYAVLAGALNALTRDLEWHSDDRTRICHAGRRASAACLEGAKEDRCPDAAIPTSHSHRGRTACYMPIIYHPTLSCEV